MRIENKYTRVSDITMKKAVNVTEDVFPYMACKHCAFFVPIRTSDKYGSCLPGEAEINGIDTLNGFIVHKNFYCCHFSAVQIT